MNAPKTMRALLIRGWTEPPQWEEVSRPTPSAGQSLVRVEAAALTHLDLTIAGGRFDIRPDLPYIGGIEGAGEVVESATFPAGTKVAIRGGGVGMTKPGTWAEYVVVRDRALTPVVDGLSPALAAVSFEPMTTAHVALHEVAQLGSWPSADVQATADEVVVVAGAGGSVGSMAAQLALKAGAAVIGHVSTADRAKLVPSGVEVVTDEEPERLAELARTRRVTLLLDTVGGQGLAERSRWVSPGGRAVVVGYTAGQTAQLDLPNWLLDDVALLPVNMLRRAGQGDAVAQELTKMLLAGEVDVAYESFAMSRGNDAATALASGQVRGKVVLVPDAG